MIEWDLRKEIDMDTEIKNELTKILQTLSDKYSNVKFNSKDLSLNIFGSKNIMDSIKIVIHET